MAEESPFIEEVPKEPEAEAQVDVDALLGQLEKFNVTDAKKLEGKLRNASDYSKIQSERDQLANELAAMRAEITDFKRSAQKPREESFDSMDSGPIDIERLAANAARTALREEMKANQEAQAKHQQWMNSTWKKISGHPKYNLVKEDFEDALRDPATVMEIQTGQRDPVQMYYDMLVGKYEGVTKQTVAAFKQLRGTGTVSPPHVESSARAPHMKSELTQKDKKINELREKGRKRNLTSGDEDDFINTELAEFLR